MARPQQPSANTYLKQVLDGHPVTKRLRQAGIKVVYKQCKQKDIAGQALQAGVVQAIVLCTNSIKGDTSFAIEVLKHEAVHASQFCWHADYDSVFHIKDWQNLASKKGFDTSYANKMAKGDDAEWEAYYLEDASDKAIVEFIDDTCGNQTEINKDVEQV